MSVENQRLQHRWLSLRFFQLNLATLSESSNVHVNCEDFIHSCWISNEVPTQMISRFPRHCHFPLPLISSVNSVQDAFTEALLRARPQSDLITSALHPASPSGLTPLLAVLSGSEGACPLGLSHPRCSSSHLPHNSFPHRIQVFSLGNKKKAFLGHPDRIAVILHLFSIAYAPPWDVPPLGTHVFVHWLLVYCCGRLLERHAQSKDDGRVR